MNVLDLGIIAYEDAVHIQKELLCKRIAGIIPDTLIVLEHKPVITFGRIDRENGIIDKGFFEKNNIPVVFSTRGGKVTYHAPGQLVLYPILDLKEKKRDIIFYINFLEKTAARSLNRFCVPAERIAQKRGVWAKGRKIGFVGISIKRWVSYHGISININNDTAPFSCINPCGENDIKVVSAKELLGRELEMDQVKKVFATQFMEDLEVEYGVNICGLTQVGCTHS